MSTLPFLQKDDWKQDRHLGSPMPKGRTGSSVCLWVRHLGLFVRVASSTGGTGALTPDGCHPCTAGCHLPLSHSNKAWTLSNTRHSSPQSQVPRYHDNMLAPRGSREDVPLMGGAEHQKCGPRVFCQQSLLKHRSREVNRDFSPYVEASGI